MFRKLLALSLALMTPFLLAADWKLGPFLREERANPILKPNINSLFYCPIQKKHVYWEKDHIFNPAAVVKDNKVYLIYRAEDDYGTGIGFHTSRLGLAISNDGIHFEPIGIPILYPDHDSQILCEFPGGCEDPRIVESEEGLYVMTYTQWNRDVAALAVATSHDLLHWQKHGYIFAGSLHKRWSKSGSIVCRQEGDRLIATKILGRYWMYWGEGSIYLAYSDDLISWQPVLEEEGRLFAALKPRLGKFDSQLVEPGPPALITKDGIVLLYNGKNDQEQGDSSIVAGAYSAGQALFDIHDPAKLIDRSEYFLKPEKSYEMNGQYTGGTVFIEGLVRFKKRWFLYYGAADSSIGVAATRN